MAKFNVVVDHQVQREEAVTKLRKLTERMRKEVVVDVTEIEETWDDSGNLDFSFKALGFQVSGSMVTCASKVTIMGSLPFAALPFRGSIEAQIAEKIREAIA